MKIGFIGAGKVGNSIGCYLKKNNIEIVGYYSRSTTSAQKAAQRTKSNTFYDINTLASKSDLIFITTPDDVIKDTANNLSKTSLDWNEKIFCHMSGVHNSNILLPLNKKGATICSLHPILSFADIDSAVSALKSTPFTLEGKGTKLDTIKEILNHCGNPWTEISTENKTLYHISTCMLSNYLVTLLNTSFDMLSSIGFSDEDLIEFTKPLIEGTVANILNVGTGKALTGPISRGDVGTLEKHLNKLNDCTENWQEIYTVLAKQTIELAANENRIDRLTKSKLMEVLKNYE